MTNASEIYDRAGQEGASNGNETLAESRGVSGNERDTKTVQIVKTMTLRLRV